MGVKENQTANNLFIVFVGICFCTVVSYISWYFKFKPIAEWVSKMNTFGNGGTVAFIFQYIYYLVESVLILFIVCFGQKFGETVFSLKNTDLIPWGDSLWANMGIGTYFFTKPGDGDSDLVDNGFYGVAYILLRKNARYTYVE